MNNKDILTIVLKNGFTIKDLVEEIGPEFWKNPILTVYVTSTDEVVIEIGKLTEEKAYA